MSATSNPAVEQKRHEGTQVTRGFGLVASVVWIVVMGSGCPSFHGKGFGFLDRAMRKDLIEEMAREQCEHADILEACGKEHYLECERECEATRRAAQQGGQDSARQ